MEKNKMIEHQEEEFDIYRKDMVHFILAHSYFIVSLMLAKKVIPSSFRDLTGSSH